MSDYEEGDANTIGYATALAVLDHIAHSIVEDEDALEIDVDDSRDIIRLNVHAGSGDMGRLIGRRGRVAGAIRTVVRAAAASDGVKVDVEFVE